MSAPSQSVNAGTTLQLSAKGTYSDSSKADLTTKVTWKSSDASIASIDSKGILTATKAGAVTASATEGTISGTLAITVAQTPVTLTALSVTAASSAIEQGATLQLKAQGSYSDGSTQALADQVAWQSSDSTVASISNAGLVSALKPGSATFTATLAGVTGTLALTITAPAAPPPPPPPAVTSVFLTPSQFSVASGQGKQLTAQAVYSDGKTQDVTAQATWKSGDDTILNVTSAGLVTGTASGTAIITASFSSKSGTASGTVTSISLSSILVTPASASVAIGQSQAFTANGIFSDGSSSDITSDATWSSAAPNIAGADAKGVATGLAKGVAAITATVGSVSGSANLTVTSAIAVSVDITPDGTSIPVGAQVPLTLTATYSDNTTQAVTGASWSSSDPTIASVDPTTGVVTGVASNANPVTVTASALGMTSTTTVTITPASLASIQLSPVTASIAAGTTQSYAVNGIFTDGTIQPLTEGLTWSSSSAFADVNPGGVATGRAPGEAVITVKYAALSASASLTVTNATLTSVAVLPATAAVGVNGTLQYTAMGIFTDNSTEDMTALGTWSSSDANVALVNATGLATGLQNGTATIGAAVEGTSGSGSLTVSQASLVSISITPDSPVLPSRARVQMRAYGKFSDGSNVLLSGVTWSTSSARYAVASSNGVVRTKRASTQAIYVYAKLNGITGKTPITISSMSVQSLALTPSTATVAVGTTQAFSLTGLFSDGTTTVDLTGAAQWQTSNYQTAVISPSGVATGVAAGTATITASWGSLTPAAAALTVSSAAVQSITVTPAASSISAGSQQLFTATATLTDGSSQDVTSLAQWSSSAPNVAVVIQPGTVISTGPGQCNIVAKFQGVSGSTGLTVN